VRSKGTEWNRTAQTDRAPFRLKVVGGVVAVLGITTVIGATGGSDITKSEMAWNVATACLLIAVGAGLCLDARWAWPIALLVAASAIGLGFYLLAQPGDITNPGAPIVILTILLIPGVAVVLTLVTPRSVRWFLRRTNAAKADS
jgi:peptidoglycan/LPS O-acetylase OafA/YrhL